MHDQRDDIPTPATGALPRRHRLMPPRSLCTAAVVALGLSIGTATAGTPVGADALRALAEEAVGAELAEAPLARGAGRVEVEAGAIDSRLALAACATPPRVEADLSRPAGRVNAKISCGGPSPWSLYVPVEIRVFREVVVASRALGRGHVLGPADVHLEERNALAPGSPALLAIGEAEGQALRRPVAAMATITQRAIEAPVLVRRGQHVQVGLRSGAIAVSASAEALRDGRRGERIRVRNLQSERVLDAVVTGPGRVEVI